MLHTGYKLQGMLTEIKCEGSLHFTAEPYVTHQHTCTHTYIHTLLVQFSAKTCGIQMSIKKRGHMETRLCVQLHENGTEQEW